MPSIMDFWFGKKKIPKCRMSTINLKHFITACASNERAIPIIEALNKEIPIASTYAIYFLGNGRAKVLESKPGVFRTSSVPIAQHITLEELQSSCELLLSEKQENYLKQLEALDIKLTSTTSLKNSN